MTSLEKEDQNNIDYYLIEQFIKEIESAYKYEQCVNRDVDLLYITGLCIKREIPGLLPYFNKLYPDKRDVVTGIEKAINIALDPKNKEFNAKSVNLPEDCVDKNDQIIKYVYNLLKTYDYDKLNGFKEAWSLMTKLRNIDGDRIYLFIPR